MNRTVFAIGLLFGLAETAYFGWNFWPQSPAEMICDGIALAICAIAYLRRTA